MKKGKKHSKVLHKKLSSASLQSLFADEATSEAAATAVVGVLAKALPKYSEKAFKVDSWVGEPILHLCGVLRQVSKSVIRIAETGDETAAAQIWETSVQLIETIHLLAAQNPGVLKPIARKALFLPSLRAKAEYFTHGFEEAQKAIELSEDCFVNTAPGVQYHLDSPATYLVAVKLEAVARIRSRMKEGERVWNELKNRVGFKCTLDDWLVDFWGHDRSELVWAPLPDYDKNSAPQWWSKVIKPYLEAPTTLETIRTSSFYRKFYETLRKGSESEADYDMVDELKKRCIRQVLRSLAPAPPSHRPPTL